MIDVLTGLASGWGDVGESFGLDLFVHVLSDGVWEGGKSKKHLEACLKVIYRLLNSRKDAHSEFLGHRLGVCSVVGCFLACSLGFIPLHGKNQNPEEFFRYKVNTFGVTSPSKMIKM